MLSVERAAKDEIRRHNAAKAAVHKLVRTLEKQERAAVAKAKVDAKVKREVQTVVERMVGRVVANHDREAKANAKTRRQARPSQRSAKKQKAAGARGGRALNKEAQKTAKKAASPASASQPAAKKPKVERQADRILSTAELEQWTELVLRCAKALGRSASNLPVYTSESSIALQVEAIGGEAVTKILALSRKEQEGGTELNDGEKRYIVETLDGGRQSTTLVNQNGAKAALAVVKFIAGAGLKMNNGGGRRARLPAGAKGRGRGRGRPRAAQGKAERGRS